jgi:hypothetical protein
MWSLIQRHFEPTLSGEWQPVFVCGRQSMWIVLTVFCVYLSATIPRCCVLTSDHAVLLQVGRAACAALQACCETSGQRFEPLAISLLPDLLKLLVISIVVVAESAHACMASIVQHCHSSRMLKGIVDPLVHDKSPRLRQRCAEYLHQMLLNWPHTVLSRDVSLIRGGVTKAVEDASPGTISRGSVLSFVLCRPCIHMPLQIACWQCFEPCCHWR